MFRKTTVFSLALLFVFLIYPSFSHAANIVLNNFGYLSETADFPTSNPGDVLTAMGVVTAASTALNCDLTTNEFTWIIKDLISEGQISPNGNIDIIVSYTGGTIGLYCDPSMNHDWGNTPPNATSIATFEDGGVFLMGSFTQFVMTYNTNLQVGYFQGMVNFTNGTHLVNLEQPNGFIFAGTIGPNLDPTVPDGYNMGTVGQILAPALCTVLGNVSYTDGTASGVLPGVTIDLVDGEDNIQSMLTDENGNYIFYDVATEAIGVSIVAPNGYRAVTPTDVMVFCQPGDTAVVDFVLEQVPVEDTPRTIGFWKHQVNSALRGKQNGVQVPVEELLGLFTSIHERFDMYFDIFVPVISLEDFRDVLAPKKARLMSDKARSQFSAMLLNVVSNRLATWQVISDDDATVSQAITFISDALVDADPNNDEAAKDVADMINNGIMVPAGMIPLEIPHIYYVDPDDGFEELDVGPAKLLSVGNYPNPFNPSTTITYTINGELPVNLAIFDIRGRQIRALVNGELQYGMNEVQWDGKDNTGRNVASGVYFYRLIAGDQVMTKRMVLLK